MKKKPIMHYWPNSPADYVVRILYNVALLVYLDASEKYYKNYKTKLFKRNKK